MQGSNNSGPSRRPRHGLIAMALVGMVKFLPLMGIALGFVPLVIGTLVTGLQLAQQQAAEEALQAAGLSPVDVSPEEA